MSFEKLRPYQKEDVLRMFEERSILNANDMGLGKTIESIALHNYCGAEKTLIVAPSTLVYNWKAEIEDWALEPYNKCVIVEGSRQQREKILTSYSNFYIINKEMLRYRTVTKINSKGKEVKSKEPIWPEIFMIDWDVVVVDEIHQFKNRKTDQFDGLKKLKTKYKIGLTGTPIDKEPHNIWAILNWLKPYEYTSYWNFVFQYCDTKPSYYNPRAYDIIGMNKAKEKLLTAELQKTMIRRLKKDCTDLPEKTKETIKIRLEGEQLRAYKQIEKEMLITYEKSGIKDLDTSKFIDLEDIFVKKYGTILERDLRLRQTCLTPKLFGGKIDSIKIDTVLDLIEGRSGPVCIFTMYKQFAKILQEQVKDKLKIEAAVVHGDLTPFERSLEIEAFSKDKTEVFIGTIPAAGTGVDGLQVANTLIFTDKDWRPKVNEQVEDRIHRIGQKNNATIISIVCEDTIEEDMEEILQNRDDVINRIVITNEVYNKARQRNDGKIC